MLLINCFFFNVLWSFFISSNFGLNSPVWDTSMTWLLSFYVILKNCFPKSEYIFWYNFIELVFYPFSLNISSCTVDVWSLDCIMVLGTSCIHLFLFWLLGIVLSVSCTSILVAYLGESVNVVHVSKISPQKFQFSCRIFHVPSFLIYSTHFVPHSTDLCIFMGDCSF